MSLRITKWKIVFVVVFFFYALPSSLYRVSAIVLLQDLFGLLSFAFCILHIKSWNRKDGIVFVLVAISSLCYVFSTVLNGADSSLLFSVIKRVAKNIGPLYVITWNLQRRCEGTLDLIWKVLAAIMLVNFATILLFPNGMYTSGSYSTFYFMGYHNSHIRWEVPMIMCKFIHDKMQGKQVTFSTFVLGLVMLVSAVMVKSATSQMVCMIILLFMLLEMKGLLAKLRLNALHSVIILGIGTVLVVGGTVLANQSVLLIRVLEYFGKGMTVNGRGIIWLSSLNSINSKPWFGYGFESADTTSMRLVNTTGWGASPHNLLLEILYLGGIVLLICVVVIYIFLLIRQKRCSHTAISSVIGLWLCIIAFMGIVEPQYEEYLKLCWVVSYGILCAYALPNTDYRRRIG